MKSKIIDHKKEEYVREVKKHLEDNHKIKFEDIDDEDMIPETGASISFSIFIASRTSNVSPFKTLSPLDTFIDKILPCIDKIKFEDIDDEDMLIAAFVASIDSVEENDNKSVRIKLDYHFDYIFSPKISLRSVEIKYNLTHLHHFLQNLKTLMIIRV